MKDFALTFNVHTSYIQTFWVIAMRTKFFSALFFTTALVSFSVSAAEDPIALPDSIKKVSELGDDATKKLENVANEIDKATDTGDLPPLSAIPALPGDVSGDKEKKNSEEATKIDSAPPPLGVLPPTAIASPPASDNIAKVPTLPPISSEAVKAVSTVPEITPDATAAKTIPVPALPDNALPAKVETTATVPAAALPPAPPLPALAAPIAPALTTSLPPADAHDPTLLPNLGKPLPPLPTEASGTPEATQILTEATTATTTPQTNNAIASTEEKPAEKPAKVIKHRKNNHLAKAKPRYKNILPETIYARNYPRGNSDLPKARYEQDLDSELFIAVRKDDTAGLRALLDYSKRNINKPNAQGDTPLITAVKSNAINSVRLLLGRHADSNARDARGMTAIDNAKQRGNYKIERVLTLMKTQESKVASSDTGFSNRYSPLEITHR